MSAAMSADVAVAIEHVSKSFRISTDPVNSLKERLVRLGRGGHVEFQALDDVAARIAVGETVSILGHNGSGKSTLLKCIAGILTPTTGQVLVRGRLTSLLELGAGFHPELSGRENVYINAAFYGMPRKEIDRRFDDIVAFAELDQFIDEPVKHYSSGMYVRLGFAVAVHLDPDVLLIDEVLAVGDERFQEKCLSRVRQFQEEGRTIVFVTHDAATARQVCDRAIVLDHGKVVIDGAPGDAIRTFREHLHGTIDEATRVAGEQAGAISAVSLGGHEVGERTPIGPGATLDLEVTIKPVEPVAEPVLGIELADRVGTVVFAVDTAGLGTPLPALDTPRTINLTIGPLWLLDGEFPLSLRLSDRATGAVIDWRHSVTTLEVSGPGRATGIVAVDVHVR